MGYIWPDGKNRELYLTGKNLSKLDIAFDEYKDLTQLYIYDNSLTELPPEIGKLTELRVLDVRRNKLTKLPKELFSLQNLWHLSLSENQLDLLPEEIGNLNNLKSLILTSNKLNHLPAGIKGLKNLEVFFCDKNYLSALPEELFSLINVKSLLLDDNDIKSISPKIGQLQKLSGLYLNNNQLEMLPEEITRLKLLERLSLNDNKLQELPTNLGELSNLTTLEINNNKLEESSLNNIKDLKNLETLKLEGNLLTAIPKEITHLAHLSEIQLYENQPAPMPFKNLNKSWDVFISYSGEERETVAIPLAEMLTRAGLRVWIDKDEIKTGDSVRTKIDEGLYNSNFGIVILSPTFLEKIWTNREFNALMNLEEDGQHTILPVWHGVTKNEVSRYSAMMLDKSFIDTNIGLKNVAILLIDTIFYKAHFLTNNNSLNLTQRFARLIGSNASVDDIKEFLLLNVEIIKRAIGIHSKNMINNAGKSEIVAGQSMPSLSMIGCTILSFLPVDFEIFKDGGTLNSGVNININQINELLKSPPAINFQEYLDKEIKISWRSRMRQFPAIIVAGRREALSSVEKAMLGDLYTQPQNNFPEIRTYDWLIDVCMEIDKG